MIGPARELRVVDGLITGWHEPEASHLQLLTAVAGAALLPRSPRVGVPVARVRRQPPDPPVSGPAFSWARLRALVWALTGPRRRFPVGWTWAGALLLLQGAGVEVVEQPDGPGVVI